MAKLLIADDSSTDMAFIQQALKGSNHDLIFARDGEEAEKKAHSEKPDLIILDVVMPKKNGFQVCRDLKKDPATQSIPIILTTSKSGDSDKFWGKKQGADDYVTKPFEPVDIIKAIKRHLGGKG